MTTLRGLEKLNEIRDGAFANREFRMSPHTAGLTNPLAHWLHHLWHWHRAHGDEDQITYVKFAEKEGCSTPIGITGTRTIEIPLPDGCVSLCSTPIGITGTRTGKASQARSLGIPCSTPIGITGTRTSLLASEAEAA